MWCDQEFKGEKQKRNIPNSSDLFQMVERHDVIKATEQVVQQCAQFLWRDQVGHARKTCTYSMLTWFC